MKRTINKNLLVWKNSKDRKPLVLRGARQVGKVTFLDLYPLSFDEFLEGIKKLRLAKLLRTHFFQESLPQIAHDQLWDLWKNYLITGGLPEAVNVYREHFKNQYEAIQAVRHIHKDLLDTYMADIAKHSGKTNAQHIERLWRRN